MDWELDTEERTGEASIIALGFAVKHWAPKFACLQVTYSEKRLAIKILRPLFMDASLLVEQVRSQDTSRCWIDI
jgi:hypothetical protein